ncbi:MAG: histidine phosphatase family protein [Bacilli bacterium]|nr:histidine phosphatase family protein [Bacilli bacterium]
METKIIYYVHGTTYDNASKRCSGWKQVELNDLGKEQAQNLGKNTPYKFDVLFSSDLIRAIDSANIAFPDVEKHQDKRLRECNYGDFDGEDKKLVVYEEHVDEPFPNGESLKDVEARIREFLKEVTEKYKGKTIGIMAHRAPQLAIEVITKHISWEEANASDWRKTGDWQPGWEYTVKSEDLD